MTDPKDSNLSPIGRKWDNTLVERPKKWSLWRAALYGLATSMAFTVFNIMASRQGLSMPTHELSAVTLLLSSLWVGPILFALIAAIHNQYVRD